MGFDKLTDRHGSFSVKWDRASKLFRVPEDNIPMWIADTDFEAPEFVLDAARRMVDHGIFGYGFDVDAYLNSIVWWMENRHGWRPDTASIFTATGLCNGIALILDTYTDPGDGVVTFNPVYHEFEVTIKNAGRRPVQVELARRDDGRYEMDLDAAQAQLRGDEKILLLCSPHNPVGRVWTQEDLESLVAFARENDLILVSDEVHQDLVYPCSTFIPTIQIDGARERTIVLTAASKTFNIAGMRIGNIIIPDPELREPFKKRMVALKQQPNTMGVVMATAAYSPEGAAWADAQIAYLDENRRTFDAGIAEIPGLVSTPLEATFLAWVDFSGTGMSMDEIRTRVEGQAGIAAQHGTTFGPGGATCLRFNIGTQHARVEEAVRRLHSAFNDLQ